MVENGGPLRIWANMNIGRKGNSFVEDIKNPAVYRLELDIKDSPRDIFIRLDGWVKGNAGITTSDPNRHCISLHRY
ncbi:unnamed protein product [Oppiella nova]|uniref:Uncharacterized protein n=1 Tax=Oppiella nova TaxID=334625 RepID=A0A7R9LT74_9ACAR|nr:unnamed protein product [Oppiella nova]CAG2166702.1 unnamed protein product [Oppiella nova]